MENQSDGKSGATLKSSSSTIKMMLDYGPLIIFFVFYKLTGFFVGTFVFMIAMIAAIFVSRFKLGHVSPTLWLSFILIMFFGGLTLWFHDPHFIQLKPTIIYIFFAALLFGGLLFKKPMLKYIIGDAFEGVSERGWRLLSFNWACFFAVMAILNEYLRTHFSFDVWLTVKIWGAMILSALFGIANMPLLLRHGLKTGQD
ncbi:MAG: septation protein IspZ [Zymomonas mobilis subsp. pomaceae]|uniref:Inner membrane-spanning protein YciB n=1 Tax=Zymomonas mobilis subsp. pomaceae (strain ATCC 29192 / DSM 22645 / JCM 10191 / CCUG 17912 / NBRC 13757 / NCIMB 11200 / NRRL B-4491 / Barker I) TaxID=579138 RepID=F8EU05_ZYMMT|nr:septation protein IspZ [Zymomonas mobilis]AEI37085.1 intracellular septation protein A [Zymomonas mobilis subsp. pomaceae ATCC 29192]MDX5948456.1 septation protein IspZ [Zymomonas mobilis subsp. pomaceae]GEB89480.1 putative intracellular septation protein A [Zymomonas mobilis subsp. pomaceae]